MVTVSSRLGHGSVTARSQLNHGEVTAGCEHIQYDNGSVTARSQLNHGPGHGSITAGCDHFGHRELMVSSRWAVTVANFFLMGYVNLIATGIVYNIQASCSHIGLMMAFSEPQRWKISLFDRRSIMNRLYWHNQQVGYICFIPFVWE